MSFQVSNINQVKNYLSANLKVSDLTLLVLIVLTSVTLAVIATYYSYIYLLALVLCIVAGIVFLSRPEWFLYFFAFSRISLDAVKF